MAEYLIKDTTLMEIANAIRNKADKIDKIPVSNFAKEINELKAGGNPPALDETLPADTSVVVGKSVVCNVLILGDYEPEDYSYQWYVNNVAVIGATSSSYTVSSDSIGTVTVYCNVTNSGGTTSSRVATIKVNSTIPEFTYTGSYKIVDDGDSVISSSIGNWKIKFLTSGTLTFTELNGAENGIDVFAVGGGGGGGKTNSDWSAGESNIQVGGGGGGGGGYATTKTGVTVNKNVSYTVTVGSGGNASSAGGTSSITNMPGGTISASGGGAGQSYAGGGSGGSGGNAGGKGANPGEGTAGKNGGSGATATKEFGSSSGKAYAGGGGGGSGENNGRYYGRGTGGSGGGGDGGNNAIGSAGTTNTGGGGGGGGVNSNNSFTTNNGGKGGSGIVIIRNKR